MNITISEKAKNQLMEDDVKNLKIYLEGYGWAGPTFGLAQVESIEKNEVFSADGFNFVVEEDISDLVSSFEIDYYKGLFKKGYVVYANGNRGSC